MLTPAFLKIASYSVGLLPQNEQNSVSLDKFTLVDSYMPMVETQVLATSSWHRVIHQDIDPRQLRHYLG